MPRKFYQTTSGVDSACGEIFRIGNASVENSQAGMIYDPKGYFPTICACTHGYAIGYIAVGSAMRGRYNSDGKTEQKIEVRDDELSNALTTVQKDSLIVEKKSWIEKKYTEFYEKHGYIPEYFIPYNGTECTDYAPTLTANSNTSPTHVGTVLIAEIDKEKMQ